MIKFSSKQVTDAINLQFESRGMGDKDCREWGAAKIDAIVAAFDHLYENNCPALFTATANGVATEPVKNKLIRAISHERAAILDIIRSAYGKLSEDNPARTALQVLDGVIANRQHGDEARVKELA